jgi:hypothetical protein
VDYVITWSQLERSFGYVRNDKRGCRVCALRLPYPNLRSQIPRYALNDGWGGSDDWLLIWWKNYLGIVCSCNYEILRFPREWQVIMGWRSHNNSHIPVLAFPDSTLRSEWRMGVGGGRALNEVGSCLEWFAPAITRFFGSLENDKPIMGYRSHYYFLCVGGLRNCLVTSWEISRLRSKWHRPTGAACLAAIR